MTIQIPWPTQISLPGQTHVAEGPHDQTGMYLMHHAFRRDLDRFQRAIRRTPVGESTVWRALAARWDRFSVVLHHHHSVEDEGIWPLMLEAVRGDVESTAVLTAMQEEHGHIDPALAACNAAFEDMAEHPCDDHRNALDVHVTATRAALLDHLRHEETEALPLLQRVMTDEQFAAAEASAAKGYPPSIFPFLVPWVADGVPADLIDRALGKPYVILLRLLRGRHARREQRVFRYA